MVPNPIKVIKNKHDELSILFCNFYNNQTNINVNSSGLDRESRARVLEVVNNILNAAKDHEVIDAEVRKVDK